MESLSPSPFDVVDNTIDAQLDDGCNDQPSSSHTNKPSFPERIMLVNNSLSDSSSAPNSPSAFAFSPISDNNVDFYASSYDTDLTSFIGSWEQHSSLDSSPSTSGGDKGKQKETQAPESEFISPSLGKGKSINRSKSSLLRSSFEFDFEFGQDNSNNHDTAVNDSTSSPSGVDDPLSHINNPISVSPSYSSIPSSPDYVSYDAEISHKSSISSLSLKSLRSSSSRSLDRIRRSFMRKDSSLFKPNRGTSLSSTPHSISTSLSPPFHSFSSRSSSSSSLKRGIRKVFGRKNSKKHDAFVLPLNDDTQETENEDFTPLDQSIISEATISPRIQSSKAGVQLQDSSDVSIHPTPLMPERIWPDLNSEDVSHKTVQGVETWLSTISNPTPRDLFSDLLPRELQLRIFKTFVYIHEDEYQEINASTSALLWTAKIAESTRWIGREEGMRALIRLGTISKLWHSLVLDGQLWECMRFPAHITPYCIDEAENLHPNAIPLPPSLLVKLAKQTGLFVRILDLRGWPHLDSASFRAISTALSRTHEISNIGGNQLSPSSYTPSTLLYNSLPSPSLLLCTETNLTHLRLRTCTGLTMHNINYIILHSPRLQVLDLHGLRADVVNDSTCELVNAFCPVLEKVDIGRCLGVRGTGLEKLVGGERDSDGIRKANVNPRSRLKVLFASGICGLDPDVMFSLASFAPLLEVLDLSYSDVTDEAIGAFVWCEKEMEAGDEVRRTVEVPSRHLASVSTPLRFTFTMTSTGTYFKRLTSLLHLNLSYTRIAGNACIFLSHSAPKLECIELAGIGAPLEAEGLVKLFQTTPFIRKIDLDDACRVDDTVLRTLTPSAHSTSAELRMSELGSPSSCGAQPGHLLEHLILSYAQNISNTAFLSLIRSCTRLTTLEVDNTRVSGSVVRTFVEFMRTRGTRDAKIAVMDCRTVLESHVNELLDDGSVRPRIGFRAFEARAIGGFFDGRDEGRRRSLPSETSLSSPAWLRDIARVEIDECDETRVALKSFWSWQALDTAREDEEKRNRLGKEGRNRFSGHGYGPSGSGPGSLSRPRWLSSWTRYLL